MLELRSFPNRFSQFAGEELAAEKLAGEKRSHELVPGSSLK
ncbi:hypothetical protein KOR42_13780 [Thalassoglobus neptunius]|uniref:Uncharacterized protein n=1 Tax=Thalassoglobus neptunius TaxID=1938619 RepID=A0A5C5X5U3_9PLAN|nr:hypothetical protein KOR42_13780 [Thalassoglobus neptunius]